MSRSRNFAGGWYEQAPKTKTLEQLERAMGEAREVIEG